MSCEILYTYRIYGLSVHSALVCPELPSTLDDAGEPDVLIQLLPPTEGPIEPQEPLENGYYEVRPGCFRLRVEGVAHYLVEDGRRILVQPLPQAQPEKVRLFLLGSALGALFYQRGLLPLHGSAVETPWGAMIFTGAQGAGKSTLAAHFERRGFRLLSDDVCLLLPVQDDFHVQPALPQVRLCADAYARIGAPAGARFDVDKYVVPLGTHFRSKPMPLQAVHVLLEHDELAPQYRVLRGFDRIHDLMENLYRPHYLKGQRTQGDLMRLAARLAERTTMVAVHRRRDPLRIEELVDFLLAAWSARFQATLPREA